MNTANVDSISSASEQSLILPTKREALLLKLKSLRVNTLSAQTQEEYEYITHNIKVTFDRLCWSKLGISSIQSVGLSRHELNELAVLIYEQSKILAILETCILACIPIVGWLTLYFCLKVDSENEPGWQNMRYFWWYRKIKNKYKQDFKP